MMDESDFSRCRYAVVGCSSGAYVGEGHDFLRYFTDGDVAIREGAHLDSDTRCRCGLPLVLRFRADGVSEAEAEKRYGSYMNDFVADIRTGLKRARTEHRKARL